MWIVTVWQFMDIWWYMINIDKWYMGLLSLSLYVYIGIIYNILLVVDQGFCHSFKDGPVLQVRHG